MARFARAYFAALTKTLCRPWTFRERQPKLDVGNLLSAGAFALTGETTGNTRMPPGLRNSATELFERVFTPRLPAFTEGRGLPACPEGNRKLTVACANKVVGIVLVES